MTEAPERPWKGKLTADEPRPRGYGFPPVCDIRDETGHCILSGVHPKYARALVSLDEALELAISLLDEIDDALVTPLSAAGHHLSPTADKMREWRQKYHKARAALKSTEGE